MAGVALAAGLVLGGCAGTTASEGSSTSGVHAPSESSSSSSSEETPVDESSTEDEAKDEFLFGQTSQWKDGLAITVSAPKAYTPSQYAAGGKK